MSKVIKRVVLGARVVAEVQVRITELIWDDDGRSFEVHRIDTDEDLTEDECFDAAPSDEQVQNLLMHEADSWRCPGCHTRIDAAQADLIVDHVRDCDRVDGAGNPVRSRS